MGDKSTAKAMMILAIILAPIEIVFLAVPFATDHWLEFSVDRNVAGVQNTDDGLESQKSAHTRYNGLFRVCYPGNDTAFLDRAPNLVDSHCFHISFDMPERASTMSAEYKQKIHLLRCWLAFYIVAIVAFLLSFIFGQVLVCKSTRVPKYAYTAALLAFITAFFTAGAIAFFHGVEYLDKNKITEDGFNHALWWSTPVSTATTRSYGWSYILGWVGVALAGLDAIFYAIAGYYLNSRRYEKEPLAKDMGPPAPPYVGYFGPGYGPNYYDYYGGGGANPYYPHQYAGGRVPAIGYEPYWKQ